MQAGDLVDRRLCTSNLQGKNKLAEKITDDRRRKEAVLMFFFFSALARNSERLTHYKTFSFSSSRLVR